MSEDVIATCDEIDAKIVRVLTEKFFWSNTGQHRLCNQFLRVVSA
jgi:hypothetical protein